MDGRGRHGHHRTGRRVEYVCLTCLTCGNPIEKTPGFMRSHPDTKFCSHKCWTVHYRQRKGRTVTCVGCGREFRTTVGRTRRRFCSMQCTKVAHKKSPPRITDGFWFENGYMVIQENGHPVKFHRWLMEQHLGRPLTSTEFVHHVDGNVLNNRLVNLMVMTPSEHSRLHRKQDGIVPPKTNHKRRKMLANYGITIQEV